MAPNPAEHLDGLLAELAPIYTIASQGSARFVAGPSGVFVLVSAGDEPTRAAEIAARLAAATRTALADHLSWVPFVDAVVVTDDDGHRRHRSTETLPDGTQATAIPFDMLGEVLVEGRPMIDDTALVVLNRLIRTDRLAPWRAGFAPEADKIDLCEPTADTTAKA
jgi:hypothetical protein